MSARVVCPKIRIEAKVWEKLLAYIQACPQEVGGLGVVEQRLNTLVVTDIFLLEQKVTAATTDLNNGAIARFVADWVRRGRNIGTLRLWWHSHATMNVFWSSTDLATIKDLADGGWLLAIVGNHKGETRARLQLGGEVGVAIDDLPIDVYTTVSEEARSLAKAEVGAKVRTSRTFLGSFREPRHGDEGTVIVADIESGSGLFGEKS